MEAAIPSQATGITAVCLADYKPANMCTILHFLSFVIILTVGITVLLFKLLRKALKQECKSQVIDD